MTTWFTADPHYWHTNVIKYSNRPYSSVEEMNEALIENWNKRVQPADHVYLLGDFAIIRAKGAEARRQMVDDIAKRLVGQIHLIHGNHDHQEILHCKRFCEVTIYKRIVVEEQPIVLHHYAYKTFHGSHKGAWNLHGHSHGSLPRDYNMFQLDVGVDVWNYAPISFEEVREEMKKHKFKPVDHHQDRSEEDL